MPGPRNAWKETANFLYVPMWSKTNNKGAIGVAVGDSPFGPFHDPLGKPLVQSEWGDIDPTVFG
jgi:hypothetical protein